ncbi:hypothetical protein pipiens_010908 [Culex pipiens pipiens]|uniref:Uncharacterized protein n=3 Tax=Culex pipiens TaxID=7175 RepID=A0ABD1D9X7_CULPP
MASIVRKIISTKKVPKAPAPYNQAVVADRTVYLSGVLGMELESLKLVDGGAPAQTAKALENLTLLLKESGSGVEKVVKTTILLANMDDYAAVNDEYKRVFSSNFPARTCFAVNKLPLGAAVEIEAIALTGEVIQVSTLKSINKTKLNHDAEKWMEQQAQHLIDATTAAFKAGKIQQNPFTAGPPKPNVTIPPPGMGMAARPGMMPGMQQPPLMMGANPGPPIMGMRPPMMMPLGMPPGLQMHAMRPPMMNGPPPQMK